MPTNLWNTQSPTKLIDFYYKIDEHKKHLIELKNVKSTFKKHHHCRPFKNSEVEKINILKVRQNNTHTSQVINIKIGINPLKISTERLNAQKNVSERPIFQKQDSYSGLNMSKVNCSFLTRTNSPNKFTKFRNRQIIEDNKKLLKKLQDVRASPELCKSKLTHHYSKSDLKYRINLQKTKYKNVDFTKEAQRLIGGNEIRFDKMNIGHRQNEYTDQNQKIKGIKLDWKQSRKSLKASKSQIAPIPKLVR